MTTERPLRRRWSVFSLVVFLVALPLCMGIAIASGVPPEKGLLTGIVGGVLVGALAGSPLQVSGPAAGLAVLVFEIVREHGLASLAPVMLLAGLLQLGAGFLRLGQWFRAISPAVVHGMLAGIGVLIVAAQVHVLLDARPQPSGIANMAAIPTAFLGLLPRDGSADEAALMVGALTIATMLAWDRLRPSALRLVPGALVGVMAGAAATAALALPVKRVQVPDHIWNSVATPGWPDLLRLGEPAIILAAVALAFIASAETLLSASAVDKMHDGPRTAYNRELAAQGAGNIVCALIGALPMTGVIVRSSANVQAGAVTRLSAVLHGIWLLGLIVLLPGLLRAVPMASLGGVLVVVGLRLVSVSHARHLFRHYGPLPLAIWAATLLTVISVDLLTGVLVGLALTLLDVLPHLRRPGLAIRQRRKASGGVGLTLVGSATFLHLPRLLRALDAVPGGADLHLRARLSHVDHTCLEAISDWIDRRRRTGVEVTVDEADTRLSSKLTLPKAA